MGARNADPMCSFGDFVAISHEVDLSTALLLKMEVTEGIIAPGFSPDALETLTAKKGGKFIILQADPSFQVPDMEYRSFGGAGFMQKRNTAVFGRRHLKNVVTDLKEFSESAKLDLILASVAIKYAPSNSVEGWYDDRHWRRAAEPRGLCEARWSQAVHMGAPLPPKSPSVGFQREREASGQGECPRPLHRRRHGASRAGRVEAELRRGASSLARRGEGELPADSGWCGHLLRRFFHVS